AVRQRDHAAAAMLEESVALFRAAGMEGWAGRTLNALGLAVMHQGDLARAEALYEEARALLDGKEEERPFASMALANLGTIALRRGDFDRADEMYAARAAQARELGDRAGEGSGLNNLAAVAYARGDLARAAELLRASVPVTLEAGNVFLTLLSLAFLAQVVGASGDAERAARIFGAAEARFGAMGFHVSPADRDEFERSRAAARAALGEAAWEAAHGEGGAMTIEQAVEYALRTDAAASPSPAAPPSPEPAVEEDAPAAVPRLRVLALGPLEVFVEGAPIASPEWSHARPRELLLYLLNHPRGRTREQVGVVFWPEASAAQVKNSFHVLLHRLRKALGHADWIVLDDDHYRVSPELETWFDAEVFEREAAAALRDSRAGDGSEARLEAAVALYRGDFLRDEAVGDWHLEVHDRLRRLYVDALSALADLRAARGDDAGAIDALERLVRVEELREDAHRRLMLALVRSGARDRAVRHHERLVRLLRDELEAEPEPETAALYERILRAEPLDSLD
ncbi:MAG TPA: BTAD domain-containing putative transcriptional regulator, partial [Longimicrobium sp.]|nr:BTAD domain-containing putative transcriptional regulator [Longimicrobium sp.]